MSDTDKLLALADAPPIPAWLIDADQSRVWAAAWETLYRAITQPAEAVEGGWPAIYGMFRAVVDAGGPETIARHGVERGSDQWVSKMRAGMLAIEWRYHPERFDEPPFTDAAQGAVAEVVETRCGCHPETCCCGDYTLKINGSYAACGSKERMHRIADAVNATHPQAAPAPEPRS